MLAGPASAASVSLSSCELCIVVIEGLVLLVPTSLLGGCLISEGRDLKEKSCLGLYLPWSLFLHNVWLWVSVFSSISASLMMTEYSPDL